MSLFHMLTTGSFSARFFSNKLRVVSAAVPNLLTVINGYRTYFGFSRAVKRQSYAFFPLFFCGGRGGEVGLNPLGVVSLLSSLKQAKLRDIE